MSRTRDLLLVTLLAVATLYFAIATYGAWLRLPA